MISLTPGYGQYVKSGIEFVVNFCNGKIYLTDTTYCELSGIPIGRVLDRLDEMQEGTHWLEIQICPTHRKEGKKSVRLIPAETIFDWLLVDRRTIAERLARETDEFVAYFYRLASSTINQLESVKSILETLKKQEKDIKLLREEAKETAERVKTQELEILRTQETANRQAKREAIKLTTNKDSDYGLEDFYTVWQYLEDVDENASLNNAIPMELAAINYCQTRDIGIQLRERIVNRVGTITKLGTVYAFPVSALKQIDKKRKTVSDHEREHYFTIPQYFNYVPNRQKKISLSDAITLNALAFNICKEKGIEVKQETFTTLGIINAFPVSVIEQVERYLNQ